MELWSGNPGMCRVLEALCCFVHATRLIQPEPVQNQYYAWRKGVHQGLGTLCREGSAGGPARLAQACHTRPVRSYKLRRHQAYTSTYVRASGRCPILVLCL